MIDAGVAIRTSLLTQTTLTSVISTRLWSESNTPGDGYIPAQGGGIAFKVRGGGTMYHNGLINPSVQFKCYGDGLVAANTVYRALFDTLHDKAFGSIRGAYCEILGQTAIEPELQWPYVLTYFKIWLAR